MEDDQRLQLEKRRKEILREDGVEKAEHDVVLDVCFATAEKYSATSASRDYAELLSFLRILVSSGNVEFLEQVLQTLWDFEMKEDIEDITEDKCPSCQAVPPGSDTEKGMACRTCHHRGLHLAVKVGRCSRVCRGQAKTSVGTMVVTDTRLFTQNGPIAAPSVKAILNIVNRDWLWPGTLLCRAITLGNEAAVKCLLKWGALASLSPVCLPYVYDYTQSPICVAVILKQPATIRYLLESGASPYHGMYRDIASIKKNDFFSDWAGDRAVCEAMWQSPMYPPLMSQVVRLMELGFDESAKCMMPYLRWRRDLMNFPLARILKCTPSGTSILDTPCYSNAERICKTLCCANVLAELCMYRIIPHGSSHLEAVLRLVLQVGTNPAGLPVSVANALYRNWLEVKDDDEPSQFVLQEYHGRQLGFPLLLPAGDPNTVDSRLAPCVTQSMREHMPHTMHPYQLSESTDQHAARKHLSPAMCRVLLTRSTDDPIVSFLMRYGGIPGVSIPDEIPFVSGFLHDGPTCRCDVQLSAAQREVSVCDLFTTHQQPKSLSYLSRAAVLKACDGCERLQSIQSLELPHVLVKYILFK